MYHSCKAKTDEGGSRADALKFDHEEEEEGAHGAEYDSHEEEEDHDDDDHEHIEHQCSASRTEQLAAPHHPFQPRAHARANEQWDGWRLPGRSAGWSHARNKRLWQGRDDEATILEHQTLMEQYSASSNNWQTIGNLFTSQIKARGKKK